VATVYIDYEARAASLKQVTDTIINANKQIGDSAELAAKEGSEAYKAMGKSMSAAFSSQEVSKALNSNIANINKNRDALNKLTGESIKFGKAAITLGGQVKQNAAQVLQAKEALAKYQLTLADTGKGTDTTEKKTQSLKGRLRELKEELSALESAGQEGTQAFEKLSIEAGKLQDQIGDTQERVKVLSSDTFKFDAALGAVKGLAAGFAIAQGAAALFGTESEELNKTIAKTQGALALLTGLQEVATLVTGQGATKISLQSIFMKEKIVVTNAAAGSVGTLAVAEEGAAVATLATKKSLDLLKVAIAGTGIGLLVIALGALYAIYQSNAAASKKFNDLMKESEEANKNAAAAIKEQRAAQQDLNDQLLVASGELKQADADKAKIRRDAAKELSEQRKPEFIAQAKLIAQEKELAGKIEQTKLAIIAAKNASNDSNNLGIKVQESALKNFETQRVATNKALNETKANLKDLKAESDKTTGIKIDIIDKAETQRIKDEAKAAADNAKQISDKAIQDRITAELNGLKLISIVNGESFKNKEDILKKEAELERASAKASITNKALRASTLLLIDAKLAQDTEQLKLDEQNKVIANEVKLIEAKKISGKATLEDEIKQAELSFTAEKNSLEAKIKLNQASAADLEVLTANNVKKIQDIRNKGIQEDLNLRVQAFELQKMLGVTTLEEELSLIRARGEAELKANEQSNSSLAVKEANRLSIIAKTDKQITDAKVVEANKRIDIDNAEAQAAVTLGTSTYEQRVKLIEDEGIKQKNSLDKKLLGEEEYNAAVVKINADTTAKLNAEQDARINKASEYAQTVLSIFGQINEISKIASELRIEEINASSEAELAAINNSDMLERDKIKSRAELAKKTNDAIKAEKRKQAVADKALAIFEIGINTAIAISKANTLVPPANIPAIIAAAAVGAVQLAAALAKPIPKFERGGEIGGQRHSQGGTMVEAEQGEYIVNRKQTSAHRRELNALNQSSEAFKKLIQDRYVRPALMNYMLSSKSKEMGVNVNATLNSKTMESELKGLRKDLRQSKTRYNNSIDSRYQWQ
jgi:predicted peroxiredoxin